MKLEPSFAGTIVLFAVPLTWASLVASAPSATPHPNPPGALCVPGSAHERSPGTAMKAVARPSTRRAAATTRVGKPATAGMVVGIDPETGRLGTPTPEQMARLAAMARGRAGVSS